MVEQATGASDDFGEWSIDDLYKIAVRDCRLKPAEFWDLSWHDCTMYMEIAKEQRDADALKEEMEWERVRSLWVPFMNANYKKKGGGEYVPTDLITLSFDKEGEVTKPTLEVFEHLVSKYGKRKKRKKRHG